MVKKVVLEKKKQYRTLIPAVPAQVETYIEEVPITVYECDFCTRAKLPSIDEYPECIGCGKHACYFCLNTSLEDLWFQIGQEEDTSGDDTSLWTDRSEDFRFGSFRICKDCLENPPEKLHALMECIRIRKGIEHLLDEATGNVITKIEILKGKSNAPK
jgi:hypothetical protein